jgi:hypothetical protein
MSPATNIQPIIISTGTGFHSSMRGNVDGELRFLRGIIWPSFKFFMAKMAPAFEDKVKRAIRDALAYDPLLTNTAMVERVSKQFKHHFAHQYIQRLTRKVSGQTRDEVHRAAIEPRLAALRETHRIARERLLQVLCWSPQNPFGLSKPFARDIVEATKNLVMLDIAVLNAEVANGLYKNLDEAAAKLDYPALPEAQRTTIASTFQKWGVLPPGSIVESVTIHATRVTTAE